MHYCIDWDYLIRITLAGLQVSVIPQTLAQFRLHPDSKSIREVIRGGEEMVAWVDRFFTIDWYVASNDPEEVRRILEEGGLIERKAAAA